MCEGTRTEPLYLNALRIRLRVGGIKIHPLNKDPMRLIEEADALRTRRKKSGEEPYDVAWVVFDSERHGTYDVPSLLRKAESLRIRVALSSPSFELWLLAHCEFSTGSCTTSAEAEAKLKRHLPTYDKSSYDPEYFLDRLDTALEHAARLRAHHARPHGDGELGNPGTGMDQLVAWMRGIAGS